MLLGIDFSYGSGLTTAQIKNHGYHFVCRYLSGGNSKDISAAEVHNYKAAGIPVVYVWETTGNEYTYAQGVQAARAADAELHRVGDPGAVVFFAQDVPVPGSANPVQYSKGAASVIGHARMGGYGDYYVINSLFNAGVISFGWQTSGGSAGHWDNRAMIRQVGYNVHVGPAQVDVNQAAFWSSSKILGTKDWFGQSPKPKGSAPAPARPAPVHNPVPVSSKPAITWSMWPASVLLKQGSKGNAVKVLQKALSLSGVYGARGLKPIDGDFGPHTATALKNFQKAKHLTVDGLAGKNTRGALVALHDLK